MCDLDPPGGSRSGTPTIQIHNVTDAVDMLSTRITIDANENTSHTAATAPVIDTTKDDVATGDLIRIDVDVAGTGAKGLIVSLKDAAASKRVSVSGDLATRKVLAYDALRVSTVEVVAHLAGATKGEATTKR